MPCHTIPTWMSKGPRSDHGIHSTAAPSLATPPLCGAIGVRTGIAFHVIVITLGFVQVRHLQHCQLVFVPLGSLRARNDGGREWKPAVTTKGLDWIGLDWIGLEWIASQTKQNTRQHSIT